MSKKSDSADHLAALLLVVARAVEVMSRIGPAKPMNAEIVAAIAAVEASAASEK